MKVPDIEPTTACFNDWTTALDKLNEKMCCNKVNE